MESRKSNGHSTPYTDSVWPQVIYLMSSKDPRQSNTLWHRKYLEELGKRAGSLRDKVSNLNKELHNICEESEKLREESNSIMKELLEKYGAAEMKEEIENMKLRA